MKIIENQRPPTRTELCAVEPLIPEIVTNTLKKVAEKVRDPESVVVHELFYKTEAWKIIFNDMSRLKYVVKYLREKYLKKDTFNLKEKKPPTTTQLSLQI